MEYRERSHRPRAYNEAGHAHELTFSCYRRIKFFSKERPCQWLVNAIQEAKDDLDYDLWAYVFMPDHVHLIVYPRRHVYDTSDFLKRVKEPVARQAVEYLKRTAPEWLEHLVVRGKNRKLHRFWQAGRGFDRNLTTVKALLAAIDYLHMNPVRKKLCEQANQWRWSSAGCFEGSPLNELKVDRIDLDWLHS